MLNTCETSRAWNTFLLSIAEKGLLNHREIGFLAPLLFSYVAACQMMSFHEVLKKSTMEGNNKFD